ncbi:MAG: NAD(+) synthase [Muribaculaceae bacterium]|nr:NAD(+) synthase [Muribaculaceae bacterium]
MKQGFYRVCCAAPKVRVADTDANAKNIIALIESAATVGADAVVFPEMCVTAYTCADLFHSSTLLEGAGAALARIASFTAEKAPGLLVAVGAPVRIGSAVYNCAIAILDGRPVALVPKTYIPGYNEFYEKRWFAPAPEAGVLPEVELWPGAAPVKPDASAIVCHKGVGVGMEICEDLWAPVPPSCHTAMAGAELILNLSASDDLIGKRHYTAELIRQQSARCICAYAYASAGFGESSTDLVFDAKLMVAENGRMLAANERWQSGNQLITTDIDIEAIRHDRLHNTTFDDCRRRSGIASESICPDSDGGAKHSASSLMRSVDPHPFVPANDALLRERCEEIIGIQVAGLAQRLDATGCRSLIVGISGGLDSTLALLVATRTFDRLGLDRKGITGITMPGFGTTGRTHANALTLMRTLGVTMREIPIGAAVEQHFSDIGHDPKVHDVTYENSQARERTQILMDVANQTGGMVLGTGDLSELALGWATYNGDHMSMYGVNAGVPKTLVKHLTRYFADITADAEERAALLDIIDTPISPELIPANPDGTIEQKTEDLVGPYELHDFFLYYTLRYGFSPARILLLAMKAFDGAYSRATILQWERTFFRRFFTQQFKRSALPDGPKVGSVCLSPRGDWRMPSDASAALWLKELDSL